MGEFFEVAVSSGILIVPRFPVIGVRRKLCKNAEVRPPLKTNDWLKTYEVTKFGQPDMQNETVPILKHQVLAITHKMYVILVRKDRI